MECFGSIFAIGTEGKCLIGSIIQRKWSAALMDTLSERLSKEDYALVEELREQVAIAQCEENESHFKYGFSAGLLVQQEAHTPVSYTHLMMKVF